MLGEPDCFCRDMWSEEMEKILQPDATEKDFERLLERIEELKNVQSIHYADDGSIEKVVYRN
jgi:hypothetical protein